jgi:hypothetical protein
MVRTQIYLTKKQRDGLVALAKATGRKQSELIRQAVDRLVDQAAGVNRQAALDNAAGMWKDREDLPDFETVRAEWNRR